jgi:hypothetical protein
MGHALPQLGRAEQLRLILGQHALELQVAEKYLERGDVPHDALGGERLLGQPRGIAGQLADGELAEPPVAEPRHEPLQVAPVGGDRVLGEVALGAQIAKKTFLPADGVAGRRFAPRSDLFANRFHGATIA